MKLKWISFGYKLQVMVKIFDNVFILHHQALSGPLLFTASIWGSHKWGPVGVQGPVPGATLRPNTQLHGPHRQQSFCQLGRSDWWVYFWFYAEIAAFFYIQVLLWCLIIYCFTSFFFPLTPPARPLSPNSSSVQRQELKWILAHPIRTG